MKLLIIYTYNKGLLSHFFKEISEKFVEDGHDVHTFYLKNRREHFKIKDVQYWGEKRSTLIRSYVQTYNVIKRVKPDIIISNFGYINPALICGKLLGVKRNIAWFHTAFGHSKRHWFHVWFKKQCFKLADLVITNSKHLSEDMTKYYGVPLQKLVEIPFWTPITGIEPKPIEQLLNDSSFLKIGCPGRLVLDKNHSFVIETLSEIDRPEKWKLFIAGEGPDGSVLKGLVQKCHLESRVEFLGLLSAEEMVSFYKGMDLIVLPSLHEAFGLVFLETIALGVPVLVSNRFGALDFIDTSKTLPETFSFDPESKDSLKSKLETHLKGEGLEGNFFKELYLHTFDKKQIYNRILKYISG